MRIGLRRREFIAGLGGAAAAWPLAARAQQAEGVRRVGLLVPSRLGGAAALRQGLAQFGWIEGRNLRIDVYQGPLEQIDDRAAELVRSAPDVIIAWGTAATGAVQQRTRIIPIVFLLFGDAMANGTVNNVARPEGNATGFSNLFSSIGGKWVELLKEVAPQISRIAVVSNPSYERSPPPVQASIETAAKAMAIEQVPIAARSAAEIAEAIPAFAARPNGGLLVRATAVFPISIYKLAVEYRLPSIGSEREDAVNGALLSYGANRASLFRQGATYVDRILRGAKVGDLPVQFPTKFELVVNLKTAKAIGVTVPPIVYAHADEVIE
jgi:putative ABC transport system substrate-binding protein